MSRLRRLPSSGRGRPRPPQRITLYANRLRDYLGSTCPAWVFATAPLTRCPGADVMLTPPVTDCAATAFAAVATAHAMFTTRVACQRHTAILHTLTEICCVPMSFLVTNFLGAGALISSRQDTAAGSGPVSPAPGAAPPTVPPVRPRREPSRPGPLLPHVKMRAKSDSLTHPKMRA